MLSKLNVSSFNNNYISNKQKNTDPAFKGGNLIVNALIASDKSPVLGVTIIDLFSMIGPRTLIDATRNGFAATETFLRESSGLIINCLTPSLIVLGVAAGIQKFIMKDEFKDIPAHKIWANSNSINTVSDAWLSTSGKNEERVYQTVKKIFDKTEGLVGKNNWKKIADLKDKDSIYREISNAIVKNDTKIMNASVDKLIEQLGASRNIRFIDSKPFSATSSLKELKLNSNLKDLTRDIKDLSLSFIKVGDDKVPKFSKQLSKLVGMKSLVGLGVVLAIGSSFQWINRHITKKRSGVDGFVGDPNFGKQKAEKTEEEKKKDKLGLLFSKAASLGGLVMLTIASFGKMPSLNMFQFSGLFPTMNQCRLISAFTFGGRIVASEDKNELRETTVRDYLGFLNLYVLGDYVAKGYATIKEKMNPAFKGQLLNETAPLKKNANLVEKAWHWIRNTELKGFEEVAKNPALKKSRAYAQAASILYSCIALGIAIPIYNKYHTERNVKKKNEINEVNSQAKPEISPTMKGYMEKNKQIFSQFIK